MAASMGVDARSSSAWPIAAASTSSSNVMAKPYRGDLPRVRGRRDQSRATSAARATSNITSAPRPTASSTASRSTCRCSPTRRTSRRSIRSCSARRAPCRPSAATCTGKTGPAGPAPRRRGLRRAGHRLGMLRLLGPSAVTAPAAASTSSSTTRSASPPARSSRAPRPIRRTSPRASRRRSCTSTATIPRRSPSPASWRPNSARRFGRDIVIDMWCYRRFGHNEGDEPSFTQPLMYAAIRKHPPISEIYGAAADRRRRGRPGLDRRA